MEDSQMPWLRGRGAPDPMYEFAVGLGSAEHKRWGPFVS
jgi:hypothetical protein